MPARKPKAVTRKPKKSQTTQFLAPKPVRESDRTSPCAGSCRHKWCHGYNAGYLDGEYDGHDKAVRERNR